MKHRIIKTKNCKTCKEVLLTICRNDGSIDFIEISAWHVQDGVEYYQFDTINCDEEAVIKRIIVDFTERSADDFANSFTF